MAVIQRRGSLVEKINPKDFVVDFAGAAQTALNVSETLKNNRLNRAKVEQGILNDQKQIEVANARIENEKERLEGMKADRAFRKSEFDSKKEMREAQLTTAQALAKKTKFDSEKNINDSKWVSDNANRMNNALSTNNWDEIDAINAEMISRGPAAAQSWNNSFSKWGQQQWTIGDETRPKSEWLAIKNAGDDKNGALGTILSVEERISRDARLKRFAEDEDLKRTNNWNDEQLNLFRNLQAKQSVNELTKNVKLTDLEIRELNLGEEAIAEIEAKEDESKGKLLGQPMTKFTNAVDRDMNKLTARWADKAAKMYRTGQVKASSEADKNQKIANIRKLKEVALSRGTAIDALGRSLPGISQWRFIINRTKDLFGTKGLKSIDKDFEEFEDMFREAGKLKGQKRVNAINKASKEYTEWLNEIAGSGALDQIVEDMGKIERRRKVLTSGTASIVDPNSRSITDVIESEFTPTNENPAGI